LHHGHYEWKIRVFSPPTSKNLQQTLAEIVIDYMTLVQLSQVNHF